MTDIPDSVIEAACEAHWDCMQFGRSWNTAKAEGADLDNERDYMRAALQTFIGGGRGQLRKHQKQQKGERRACANYRRPKGIMGGPCLNCGRSQPEHARRVQEAEIVRARERNAAIEECAMRIERADNSLWMKPNDLITYVRALKQPT